ncbi:MAG: M48 family metalloprotease [Bdellovibrionota bacterium]
MNLFLALSSGLLLLGILYAWYLGWLALPRLLRRLEANPAQRQEPIWLQVQERLEEVSAAYRVKVPELRVLPEFSPNALLARRGRSAYVVLSEGLVRTLSGEELDAALALCLAHVYARGRTRHTMVALALFPFAQFLQSYPVVFQFLFSPPLTFCLRLASGPKRVLGADRYASQQVDRFRLAAMLQKISVLARKIPLERWNLALDSLFLVSPLALESQPFHFYFLQPSVAQRRALLLGPDACES